MTDELLSLRTILVSASVKDRELFRRAASDLPVPIEVVDADGAAAAGRLASEGADFVFIDGSLPSADISQVVSAVRAGVKPPFTVLLAARGTAEAALTTDALATRPTNLQEARLLVDRSSRICIPSRVLLVDDSSTMRSIVRKILLATRFPFAVSEATEGLAAIKLASEAEFDIVFLDFNMPGFNGLETLSEFKRGRRQMTVVVITSAQDEALVNRVHEQGAAFLKKPFYPADIEAVLTRHYGLIALNPKRA